MATAKVALTKGKVTELVQLAYIESERVIQPMAPFILIRTLPRATVSAGGILLPEKQNKPNIEAVVLAVYEPYWEKVDKVDEDGKHFDISVWNECDVKVGDHIICPHHVGVPDSFLDDREYRLIREDDAIATLHYRPKGSLKQALERLSDRSMSKRDFLNKVLEDYDVVPKEIFSQTTSGV